MLFGNHDILLMCAASTSCAALIFFVVYILYTDKIPRKVNVAELSGSTDSLQAALESLPNARPSFIARAIGGNGSSHQLRAFRAANMFFVALPVAWRLRNDRVSSPEPVAT